MHEIVTLQLGQRSNYLATHFWNTQESYFTYSANEQSLVDHNVHFRAGIGADGSDTYTPRTVIYDLKGGFGSLRKINALYEIPDDTGPVRGLWDGLALTQQQPQIQPTQYQERLDQGLPTFQIKEQDVRYWSDFNRIFYHPKSIVQLNDYDLNSQIRPFENWIAGQDLFQTLDKEFDLIDRDVRPFVEECDQMQGLQILTSTDDAWGGFAANYVENLRDEYGKTGIWLWGLESGERVARSKQLTRNANTARSLTTLGGQASIYVRVSDSPSQLPSYIHLERKSEWQKTAALCSAMESVTLPTRLVQNETTRASLNLFADALNTTGNQILVDLHVSVGRKALKRSNTQNGIADQTTSHTNPINGYMGSNHDLTQYSTEIAKATTFDVEFSSEAITSEASHVFAQVESYRHKLDSGTPTMRAALEVDERIRHRILAETVVERFDIGLPFPVLDTFPDTLFHVQGSETGLDVLAGLSTHTRMKDKIISLRDISFRSIEVDEREAIYNDLTEISGNYGYGWESGTDSGEDS